MHISQFSVHKVFRDCVSTAHPDHWAHTYIRSYSRLGIMADMHMGADVVSTQDIRLLLQT